MSSVLLSFTLSSVRPFRGCHNFSVSYKPPRILRSGVDRGLVSTNIDHFFSLPLSSLQVGKQFLSPARNFQIIIKAIAEPDYAATISVINHSNSDPIFKPCAYRQRRRDFPKMSRRFPLTPESCGFWVTQSPFCTASARRMVAGGQAHGHNVVCTSKAWAINRWM